MNQGDDVQLSVVIPIYNASIFIEKSVVMLIAQLDALHCPYEILLCDDSSRDDSRAILEKISGRYPQVKYFYNEQNRGLGHTLKVLFSKAQGETIICLDIDLPFGAEVVPRLLGAIGPGCDIAVASRYLGGRHNIPFLRRLFSRSYYLCCKLFFNIPVKDMGSESIACKRKVLNAIELKQERFIAHVEFFLKSQQRGFSIKELPMEYSNHRPGSFRILKHARPVIADTVELWKDLMLKK